MKKVLISEKDMQNMWNSALEMCESEDNPFKHNRSDITKDGFRMGARIFEYMLNKWFNAQPDASNWVSIEDDLPPLGVKVFLRGIENDKEAHRAAIRDERGYFLMKGNYLEVRMDTMDVTHWMPIPLLPEIQQS